MLLVRVHWMMSCVELPADRLDVFLEGADKHLGRRVPPV
ncbi:hypothetical protein D187_008032 [Cystobacter fuscus DSM 2262]|uniref:Uncharacterized protein n=1 Tax=Cystobacter fuscus (strain ATCC 25194 / DSM 2262 / NBRC 100088 / M29) TaxID=1242864 RepID=S9NWW9_CYSF2|nr:hypothetical protein D187_008032 [Cystobacter fuscus DSM 2262]